MSQEPNEESTMGTESLVLLGLAVVSLVSALVLYRRNHGGFNKLID